MPLYVDFPFRFGPGPCCCPCWQFTDDFYRNPSTDVGEDWNESEGDANGDWGIADWHLYEKVGGGGTADAVIFCRLPCPDPSGGKVFILFEIWEPVTGDKDYVYPCCPDDDTLGDLEVEFHCTTAPSAWTVTVRGAGGDHGTGNFTATVFEDDLSADVYVKGVICLDEEVGQLKAYLLSTGDAPVWVDDADLTTDRYVALGHDNETSGVIFDNFTYGELRTPSGQICYGCFCLCLDMPLPRTLKATIEAEIVAPDNRAKCMDGLEFELEWDWAAGAGIWKGTVTVPATDDGGESRDIDFWLGCSASNDNDPDWPGRNISMAKMFMGNTCGTDQQLTAIAADSDCDPLKLKFGPWQLVKNDMSCRVCWLPTTGPDSGEYYIWITEA